MKIGVHVSITGSIDLSIDRALQKDCNTFQIFTHNPRGWGYNPLHADKVDRFIMKVDNADIDPVVAHMPYLSNLASPKKSVYLKSKKALKLDLGRCLTLRIPYLVTHLGSHIGSGREYGAARIVDAINEALGEIGGDVMLLLENTAGTKNSMGSSFSNIAQIMDEVADQSRVGMCFDTCHAYAAGYDLKTPHALSKTLKEFEEKIGIDRLKVVHMNDSKGGLGSKVDRHEHIGLGMIGDEGFKAILSNNCINKLPLILETPIDQRRDDIGNLNVVKAIASRFGMAV